LVLNIKVKKHEKSAGVRVEKVSKARMQNRDAETSKTDAPTPQTIVATRKPKFQIHFEPIHFGPQMPSIQESSIEVIDLTIDNTQTPDNPLPLFVNTKIEKTQALKKPRNILARSRLERLPPPPEEKYNMSDDENDVSSTPNSNDDANVTNVEKENVSESDNANVVDTESNKLKCHPKLHEWYQRTESIREFISLP
jgi:hypothetical protein